MQDLSKLTEALLDAARKAGADAADAIATQGTSLSIEVRDGALEQAERSEGVDIGLRVLIGQRQAIVSASDTKPETISEMAERAVTMARLAPEDPGGCVQLSVRSLEGSIHFVPSLRGDLPWSLSLWHIKFPPLSVRAP